MLCPLTNESCKDGYCSFYNKEREECCIPILADCMSNLINIANAVTSPNYEDCASVNIRG